MTDATLFVGGRIFTGRRYCSALLIEDGEVLVAGSEAEARRAAPSGTDVCALDGDLVIPGLIDAHFHVAEATRVRDGLTVGGAASLEAIAASVGQWAAAHPTGTLVARGFDPERLPSAAWPTRQDLDEMSRDRPLVLIHASGHVWLVNSVALSMAGIDRGTPDPSGGKFGRDPDGVPDGRVYEGAIPSLGSRLPPPDRIEPEALLRTLEEARTFGLTTIGAMNADPEETVELRELAADGRLPTRLRVYLRGRRWEEYFRDPGGPSGPPDRFEVIGVKAFVDGAFGPRTAWLTTPYADDPTTAGMAAASDEELRTLFEAARRRALVPAIHAIGDRAISHALGLLRDSPLPHGRRYRIEHAALTPPELWAALGEVRPALVVQPGFVWSDAWLGLRLGPARQRWAYAFRTLIEHGHLLVGSSDAPYDPIDPWRGLRAAVHRTDPGGGSANPSTEETLGVEDAIRLYTGNAGLAFGEPTLGWLEAGSPGDLVRLAAPSLDAAISAGSTVVRGTWLAGVPAPADRPGSVQRT